MKKIFIPLILLIGCSKSNTTPQPVPVVDKKVLMRIEFSGAPSAHVDSVYIGDATTHLVTLVGGPYYNSTSDSVSSPDGMQVQVTISGVVAGDSAMLIDQDGHRNGGRLIGSPTLLQISNFSSKDSFTIKVWR